MFERISKFCCVSKGLLDDGSLKVNLDVHERCIFRENKRITTVICINMEIKKLQTLKDKGFTGMQLKILAENSRSVSSG